MKLYLTTLCTFLLFSFNQICAQTEMPITTIEVETTEFDFGTINSGEKVHHTYSFKNTGDQPMIISNAKGSCGCTVPYWPKEPIMPGEMGEIEVTFDSKGKQGKQSKRVTITANTDPAQLFLVIKGEVLEVEPEISEGTTIEIQTNEEVIENIEEASSLIEHGPNFKPSDCFAIYPNPTAEVLNLDVKDHVGQSVHINIYNQSGKLMTKKTIDAISDAVITFDVSQYVAGMYYANIQIDQEQPSTKCFVIAE